MMARARNAASAEKEPLSEYARKRDFDQTSEPGPARRDQNRGRLSFVIQKHSATRLHYDFRLELDGVLKSWSVPKGPSLDPLEKRLAVQVEDHPLDYGGFEGVIPRGQYGAGPVIVWDRGAYVPERDTALTLALSQEGRGDDGDTQIAQIVGREEPQSSVKSAVKQQDDAAELARKGLSEGKLSFQLHGSKLRGSWALVKLQKSEKEWLLIKHRDEFAQEGSAAGVLDKDRSVLSGRTVEEVRAGKAALTGPEGLPGAVEAPFPTKMEPMLATPADHPFTDPAWVFEPKLDGIRAVCFIRDGKVRITTRRGNNATQQYPALAAELATLPHQDLVLDGEIVALDAAGRPSFQTLQLRMNLSKAPDIRRADEELPVFYYVFDVLYEDGFSLAGVPLTERHKRLPFILPSPTRVLPVDQFEEDGEAAFRAVVSHGLEGLIAKRSDSRYEQGRRSHAWLKIKVTDSDDFIICGYTKGQGNRDKTFGALLLGSYDGSGKLVYAGNVGTGFDTKKLQDLKVVLDGLKTEERPFAEQPDLRGEVVWTRPELVAEITFAERTNDGRLRAPVFVQLRPDKPAGDVRRVPVVRAAEVVSGFGFRVSSPLPNPKLETLNSKVRSAGFSPLAPGPRPDELGEAVAGVLNQLKASRKDLALEVEGHRLPVSNLNKEFWPAFGGRPPISKRAFLRYLAQIAPYFLPHLKDRPLTLIRFPDGINGEQFYQRHWEHRLPEFVQSAVIYSDHNVGDTEHLLCNNLATLLWLGQIAGLEIHSWYSRISQEPDAHHLSMNTSGSLEAVGASVANYPDFMVFDLDPYIYSGKEAKGAEPELNKHAFLKTCDVALWLKELLDQLSLNAFVKTTGKTGLHLFVPIVRKWDYDETRAVCQALGQALLRAHPMEITMDWAVKKRPGKVFFDHNQNVRSKTLASIFSPRASREAAVSTPLRWEQVGEVYPTDFTIYTVPDLLAEKGDPWAGILEAKTEFRF